MRSFLVILMCCVAGLAGAQTEEANPASVTSDSATAVTDTIVERRNGILDVFEGNPGKAAVRGLLIPAGGQIYNRRWWKVPLALAVDAATISYLVYAYQQFGIRDTQYDAWISDEILPDGFSTGSLLLKSRNSWRQQKELGWVFFAVGHIFTAFEAYIDRHLLEFDVSDDLTFMPTQTLLGPVPAITYTIPLSTNKYKTVPVDFHID